MKSRLCTILAASAVLLSAAFATDQASAESKPLNVLLIDGQNNHKWQETTPLIQATLESGDFAKVTVATAPGKGEDKAGFAPKFTDYDVVVSNYNGEAWSSETEKAFETYVSEGGGFVTVHAADNSFPKWDAYNQMIGVGGWGGRNEKDGPYVRWKEDQKKFTRDMSKGGGGQHGKRVPFMMVVRDASHPITAGLPKSFLQVADELYGKLRGPAENMDVLATAYSNPATGGTGEHEPILMTIQYGEGRVFHTTLGHDVPAMKGLAFQTSLRRGTEWAATGSVTLAAVAADTMGSDEAATGDPAKASEVESGAKASPSSNVNFDSAPDLKADGWKPLFDGKSLDGWNRKNGTAKYRVEDGTIVGTTSEG
ncbi:MAG: ThuA domain-containing protein, partial [Rhodopirellula bahusiensis]